MKLLALSLLGLVAAIPQPADWFNSTAAALWGVIHDPSGLLIPTPTSTSISTPFPLITSPNPSNPPKPALVVPPSWEQHYTDLEDITEELDRNNDYLDPETVALSDDLDDLEELADYALLDETKDLADKDKVLRLETVEHFEYLDEPNAFHEIDDDFGQDADLEDAIRHGREPEPDGEIVKRLVFDPELYLSGEYAEDDYRHIDWDRTEDLARDVNFEIEGIGGQRLTREELRRFWDDWVQEEDAVDPNPRRAGH